jgi:hypothetical protein
VKEIAKTGSVILGFLILFAVVGSMDAVDAQASSENYCAMVELWEQDSHLAPEQRRGWPPYKGVEKCQ